MCRQSVPYHIMPQKKALFIFYIILEKKNPRSKPSITAHEFFPPLVKVKSNDTVHFLPFVT